MLESQFRTEASRDITRPRYFKNFLELDEYGRNRFAGRVRSNNGTVRVIVHPYYESYHHPERYEPQSEQIEQALHKMVRNNGVKSTPIIIFEEQQNIPTTQRSLGRHLPISEEQRKANGELYFVPTYKDDSEPKFTPLGDSGRKPPEPMNWQRLADRLKQGGVKEILLSGMYLMTPKYRNDPRFIEDNGKTFQGCVNGVVQYLGREFTIEVSHLNFPANRIDVGPQLSADL